MFTIIPVRMSKVPGFRPAATWKDNAEKNNESVIQ